MENKEKLLISKLIDGNTAVSADDGQLIFDKIKEALYNNKLIELDFEGIEILTTAFLNAAIGQLYNIYTSDKLNEFLKLKNVSQEDLTLFQKVIRRAKEYYANPKGFGDSANDAIYGT